MPILISSTFYEYYLKYYIAQTLSTESDRNEEETLAKRVGGIIFTIDALPGIKKKVNEIYFL